MGTPDVPGRPGRAAERAIPAMCQDHGRCTLRMTRHASGIVLDPHARGSCMITLDEAGTAAMRTALVEWRTGE